ncbi:MAG: S9 family peptidase, partial [Steroidobacteraceae bacterium]|nr:S9 family peptidase [Steroidobacteraceae bacterium]MDW8260256.1 S9 family peptidase [Gammaproteobacteria bacterium]
LDGGEPAQVSDFPLDVTTLKISPDGKRIAFTIDVFPDCGADLKCSKDRLDQAAKSAATGRRYDKLLVRHWASWENGTRSRLFTAPLGADGRLGALADISGPVDGNVPSRPMGGDEEYAFSPDGARLVFAARIADRSEAWSTNFDLYERAADGSGAVRNLTADNPAWDTQPVFLADGTLAWLAMRRPGFEADRFEVMLLAPGATTRRELTRAWDRSVSRLSTTADGRHLLATADDLGQHSLFRIDRGSGAVRRLYADGQVNEFVDRGTEILLSLSGLFGPADLYRMPSNARDANRAALRRITAVNASLLADTELAPFEQFSFAGAGGATVYGYLVWPAGFVPQRKYPLAFIVHGGPQTSFGNLWSYRWNPQVFAGRGYAVLFIDFHGSSGYGQAFTDAVSQDWGGKPFEDLQKGLEAALARYPWIDGTRVCSLGASYGGFMQNWIAGRWPDRFRCIVNHAGIFDTRMMYYSTEELWFTEWENGGPYFAVPQNHEAFNPARFVTEWRTPMLVIHGARDYRVPYTQGLATFTALQRRGIESRFLFFPDEGHWILQPANSKQWHDTVLDWLDRFLKMP